MSKKIEKNTNIAEINELRSELELYNFIADDSTIDSVFKLYNLTKKHKSSYEYCLSLVRLSEYYTGIGNYTLGNSYVAEAIALSEANEYSSILSNAYMAMAFALSDMMDDTNALDYFLKGVDLSRKSKNFYDESLFLNNIGDLFMQCKQYDEARPFIEKAMKCWQKHKGKKGNNSYITMHLNMAKIYINKGEIEKAQENIDTIRDLVNVDMWSYPLLLSEEMEIAFVQKDYEEMYRIGNLIVEKLNSVHSQITNIPIAEDCAEMAIVALNKPLADSFMSYLYKHHQQAECSNHSKKFAMLLLQYCLSFKINEHLEYAYKHYAQVDYQLHEITKANKVMAFNNKIHLHEAVKKHEKMAATNKELETLSLLDELTQTPNRRAFNQVFQTEFKNCVKEQQNIALIYFDIDYFKEFNDTCGHLEGDKVLKSVAQVLKCEQDMYVARVGGDEFLALISGMPSNEVENSIVRCRERLRELHIAHVASSINPFVTFTCGYVNMIPTKSTTKGELIRMADDALYKAKLSGRNTWCGYEEEDTNE